MRGGIRAGLYYIFDYFACFCAQGYRIYCMEHAHIAHPNPAGFMASARVPALGPEYVTCADRPSPLAAWRPSCCLDAVPAHVRAALQASCILPCSRSHSCAGLCAIIEHSMSDLPNPTISRAGVPNISPASPIVQDPMVAFW